VCASLPRCTFGQRPSFVFFPASRRAARAAFGSTPSSRATSLTVSTESDADAIGLPSATLVFGSFSRRVSSSRTSPSRAPSLPASLLTSAISTKGRSLDANRLVGHNPMLRKAVADLRHKPELACQRHPSGRR